MTSATTTQPHRRRQHYDRYGFDRGARCTVDFSLVDHLSLVDEPLEDVRARFGVPPREI